MKKKHEICSYRNGKHLPGATKSGPKSHFPCFGIFLTPFVAAWFLSSFKPFDLPSRCFIVSVKLINDRRCDNFTDNRSPHTIYFVFFHNQNRINSNRYTYVHRHLGFDHVITRHTVLQLKIITYIHWMQFKHFMDSKI